MIDPAAIALRSGALMAACFLYGVAGSPTPDGVGAVEILVAALLLIALHPPAAMQAVTLRENPAGWARAGQALFFYGLTLPLLLGLAGGHDASLILRDMIPFCFLLLPLFMQGWRPDPEPLGAMVAFIGVAFGARVLWPVIAGRGDLIGSGYDPLSLSTAPTVSFAAILCGGAAGLRLYRGLNFRNMACACLLAACALLPVAAMAATLQRAGLGLTAGALLALLAAGLLRRPARAVAPLLFVLAAMLCFAPVIGSVAEGLLHKQILVGNNNRFQEAAAVLDAVSESPFSLLFGKGWGAALADPAAGGRTVNYTHNILTTYLLKTGLAGVALLLAYLYGLCRPLLPLARAEPLIALALGVPLVIDLTLYASFKSLDFGLVLLLVMLRGQKLHENPR